MDQNIIYVIILVTVLFFMFYYFMVRPQRRQQKEHQDLVDQLKSGDMVVTSGGIYGAVESVDPDSVVLRIESGGAIRVAKANITGRVKQVS
jgi:preprotein translocase subunit YajC